MLLLFLSHCSIKIIFRMNSSRFYFLKNDFQRVAPRHVPANATNELSLPDVAIQLVMFASIHCGFCFIEKSIG